MPHPPARAEFTARYLVESSVAAEQVAQVIVGEQSSGTFLSLPGETDALKQRSRARVVRIDTLPPTVAPSLASACVERRPHACGCGAIRAPARLLRRRLHRLDRCAGGAGLRRPTLCTQVVDDAIAEIGILLRMSVMPRCRYAVMPIWR